MADAVIMSPSRPSRSSGRASILLVRHSPDPVLSERAAEVTAFDVGLGELAASMSATMHAGGGVGLAAPQVGVLRRLLVWSYDDAPKALRAGTLVNPTIVDASSELVEGFEGCLSFPGVTCRVLRPAALLVAGFDVHGAEVSIEVDGWLARILGHEIDHLDGVTMVRRGRIER